MRQGVKGGPSTLRSCSALLHYPQAYTDSESLQWFEKLVGGLRMVDEGELRLKGAAFGWDMNSFVINVQVYLPW